MAKLSAVMPAVAKEGEPPHRTDVRFTDDDAEISYTSQTFFSLTRSSLQVQILRRSLFRSCDRVDIRMRSSKYALHHVGGRWGNGPFPRLSHFTEDLTQVFYEADSDAIPAIISSRSPADPERAVIAACLSGKAEQLTLNVTFNPGGTSLLNPNVDNVKGLYDFMGGVDFDLDVGMDVIEQRRLRADTLDSVITATGYQGPDFLSLDTQGTEYEILCKAAGALSKACGLLVEVEFVELYHGQKRFHDIVDLLGHHGFSFIRFESLGELSGPRYPLGFRGRGRQLIADALFLREPGTVTDLLGLIKLAFTCFVFGHVELALVCLERVDFDMVDSEQLSPSYSAFLREAKDAYAKLPAIFPPLWSNVLGRDRAVAFAAAPFEEWIELFDLEPFATLEFMGNLDDLCTDHETEFEKVLRRYGLHDVATNVVTTRIDQATKVKQIIMNRRKLANERNAR